jgi:hypothetical protein
VDIKFSEIVRNFSELRFFLDRIKPRFAVALVKNARFHLEGCQQD